MVEGVVGNRVATCDVDALLRLWLVGALFGEGCLGLGGYDWDMWLWWLALMASGAGRMRWKLVGPDGLGVARR